MDFAWTLGSDIHSCGAPVAQAAVQLRKSSWTEPGCSRTAQEYLFPARLIKGFPVKSQKWGSAQTHPSQIHIYCHPQLYFCFMKVMLIPQISSCGTMVSPCSQRKTLTFVRAVSLTCSATWIWSHTLWNLSPAPAAQTAFPAFQGKGNEGQKCPFIFLLHAGPYCRFINVWAQSLAFFKKSNSPARTKINLINSPWLSVIRCRKCS